MVRLPRVGPEAFDGTRLREPGVAAVAFLADWCPFCRAFAPGFASLADEPHVRLAVADLTDPDSPLWDRFGIDVVPTVIVFVDGVPTHRADGVPGAGLGPDDLQRVREAIRSARAGSPGPRARGPRTDDRSGRR